MSIRVKMDLLGFDIRQKIDDNLRIKLEPNKYMVGAPCRYIYPYDVDDNNIVYLPFSYACQELKLKPRERKDLNEVKVSFEGKLREMQVEVKKEALKILSKKGSVLISLGTGLGKTCLSIALSCRIGFRTLVIVNKVVLMKQWESSIKKFCPEARVQIVKPKDKLEDCDFYIINAMNVEKMGKEYFSDIGTCVLDEVHLLMAETLSKSLKYIYPRYLIGLSATPYRPDGLNMLLDLYLGPDKIIRKLYREHIVYRVNSGFVPTIELTENGKMNWNTVLKSQSEDESRNRLIIDIVKHFKDRVFLILTKRIEQGNYLVRELVEEGEDVTSLIGKQQEFEASSRILIGTVSKVGVGFDHPRLDTLLLAADVEEYFIQYLGRVFRRQDTVPIIFDIVDKNPIIEKHYKTRKEVFIEHGGKIKNFNREYPEFFEE